MSLDGVTVLLLVGLFITIHLIFIVVFLAYMRNRFVVVYSRLFDLNTQLNYHAVALAENNILPMPWELDELENIQEQIKIDIEDNIVYIKPKYKPEQEG